MISNQHAQEWFDLAEQTARNTGVRDVEVWIHGEESALTRFANNVIHQNVAAESREISIRVAEDGRTARAGTNRLTPDGIRQATLEAVALARASEPDPNLLPLYGGQPISSVNRFDPRTAALSPAARATAVKEAIDAVESAGHSAAGIFSNEVSVSFLLNSNGVFARHDETGAVFSITATATDSSGWAKASEVSAGSLDTLALARGAAEKATRSANPVAIDPGRYTVVLEPAAVLDLVGQMFADCSATALEEERSFLNGRLDQRLFGENITIRDDVRHPLQDGAPFDGEGVSRQPLVLFDRGVPRDMPYSRAAAHRQHRQPTGHGFPLPNESGESPQNIVFQGESHSLADLVRRLKRGILVTRLWYIREVDPFRKVMTGMTRDGTFLVEDGEIVAGLRNFRFNESLVELLNQVEAMSREQRSTGEEAFDMVVPAILAHGFHFTEVTLF